MLLNPVAGDRTGEETGAGDDAPAGELACVLLEAEAGPPLLALAVALVELLGSETFGCQLSKVEPEKLTYVLSANGPSAELPAERLTEIGIL